MQVHHHALNLQGNLKDLSTPKCVKKQIIAMSPDWNWSFGFEGKYERHTGIQMY